MAVVTRYSSHWFGDIVAALVRREAALGIFTRAMGEAYENGRADADEGAVDVERIARALAERIVGVQVRREDEPVVVSRMHRDLAAYIVRGQ